ncbi:hypothetical protein AB0B28_17500 [Glycomyces sp. NPDC046736]|uniref:hypothetical protein n=1 Tax=Glycomyces sp. NPDC046736 TaxID=3155615 RepID=UPI0033FE791D
MTTPLATGPDPLAIGTFIIAVLGFLGAATALIWQFMVFRLSGARIKIDLRGGFAGWNGLGQGGIYTFAFDDLERNNKLANLKGFGQDHRIVHARVRNVGRMATSGTEVRLCSPRFTGESDSALNESHVPRIVEAQGISDWYFDSKQLKIITNYVDVNKHNGRVQIWVEVDLANGRTVSSKKVLYP